MPDFSWEVSGIEETLAMLDHVEQVVETTAVVNGLVAAANIIANEVELRTPVKDESGPTSEYFHRIVGGNSLDKGQLKSSVKYDIVMDSKNRGGFAIISHGAFSYVANYLEYGHRLLTHGKKAIRRVIGFVKPFPFIRPAAEAKAVEATDAFYAAVGDTLVRQGLASEHQEAA